MGLTRNRERLRIGIFGLFGTGNSGNEASLDAILAGLKEKYPDALVDSMSSGFRQLPVKHGIEAIPLSWYEYSEQSPGPAKIVLKVFGKLIDPLRIFLWVGRHDAIIVPGMGVLEDTTPVNSYGFPLAMFLLALAGRICQVKVALVSIGASVVKKPATRFLFAKCAAMAAYRSYRDDYSRNALHQAGVDTSADNVYPDLAFSLSTPDFDPGDPFLVAVGVMDYSGGNDDRDKSSDLHSVYLDRMTEFVRWLLVNNYHVRFFGGDELWDHSVAEEISNRIQCQCPDIDVSARAVARKYDSYADLLYDLNQAGTVVATRYHNVIGALKLCKPTIAVGYARKFIPLMEGMGLSEFVQFADTLDVNQLIVQFQKIQARRAQLVPDLAARNAENAELLGRQSAILDEFLFGVSSPAR